MLSNVILREMKCVKSIRMLHEILNGNFCTDKKVIFFSLLWIINFLWLKGPNRHLMKRNNFSSKGFCFPILYFDELKMDFLDWLAKKLRKWRIDLNLLYLSLKCQIILIIVPSEIRLDIILLDNHQKKRKTILVSLPWYNHD